MRVILVLALLACAFAFQGANVRSARSLTMMAEKSKSLPFMPQPAALTGMAGDVGFDPFGFSSWIDIKWLREAELKHCRVAMLGALGFITTDALYKLPGDMHQVSSVAAHDAAVSSGAMAQILLWTSLFEIISVKAVSEMMEGSGRAPGYFGFDPLKYSTGKPQKTVDDLAMKELANGRLAMLAFGGMVTGSVLSDKGFPYY